MQKKQLAQLVDTFFELSGLTSAYERRMRSGITVLMYHRVLPDEQCVNYPLPSLVVPLSVFESQVKFLSQYYEVMTCADAVEKLHSGQPTKRPVICLTFDDGYEDNALVAAPVLEKYGLRATFFITTDLIGKNELLWFDLSCLAYRHLEEVQLREILSGVLNKDMDEISWGSAGRWTSYLKSLSNSQRLAVLTACRDNCNLQSPGIFRLMDKQQVQSLARAGHEIGSHTLTHPLLPQLDDQTLEQELRESMQAVRSMTGQASMGFCYPNGDHDDRICEAVRNTGYNYACVTNTGMNRKNADIFKLRRFDMNPGRVMTMDGELNERAFRGELCGYRENLRKAAGKVKGALALTH